MADLTTSVRYLKGIGEKKAQAFEKLGVFSLYDLLSYFPSRYEDRTRFCPIAAAPEGEGVCIRALVADMPRLVRVRRGMELVKFRAVDESGSVDITYFNQNYVKDYLTRGDSVCFYGKVERNGSRLSMVNPAYEKEDKPRGVTGCILPVYRMNAALNQRTIRDAVRRALDVCGDSLPELLPAEICLRNGLAQARYAYENIHYPPDFDALAIARRRLVFEELFVLACALGTMRAERTRENGIPMQPKDFSSFYAALPFTPTGAQRRAIAEAAGDMTGGFVMNRLVQGDVGSGKTLVAAALCWLCRENGCVSAFMAPTEILAEQHFATLSSLLAPFGMRVGKLTGAMSAKEKREARAAIAAGEYDLVVGTHALFSEDVAYARLGLIITDEQHRFGVRQRSALIGKGEKPHVLVMSATPIPRTLALMIYGDLDVSIIDELPPGRQKVDTFAVDESYRARLNGFIRKLVGEGRQVFVVCPKVEDDEDEETPSEKKLKSAEEHAKDLAREFPELTVGCVHGRMKAKEKDAVMAAFVRGEMNILVATTVIEVGVDVPNAALMIIENAERFGLSQLHQLRGRVGRGQHKSWCILVSDNKGEEVRARLSIMSKTNNGFAISEEDLRLRGPGDFFGARQHGLPEMHVANLGADTQVLKTAQDEAKALLAADPQLTLPEHTALRNRIETLFKENTDSFN
ncbi:MAG: ATP-dependent DNA helicase RecG [Oscillospiraceae bacterium]|nr:ATP-dependent DNA helicase RecG [Oscillospiraceae bacterium]